MVLSLSTGSLPSGTARKELEYLIYISRRENQVAMRERLKPVQSLSRLVTNNNVRVSHLRLLIVELSNDGANTYFSSMTATENVKALFWHWSTNHWQSSIVLLLGSVTVGLYPT